MSLPAQRSEIEANLMHADWYASHGMVAQAAALYRTAASRAEDRGDRRAALSAYAAVARCEGPGSDAKVRIGELQLALGWNKEAAQSLERAANEALAIGRIPLGLRAFALAAQAEPTRARWVLLRDWCVHLGRLDDAVDYLEQATDRAFAAGDAEAFIAAANPLLELRPDHVPVLRRLVRAHLQRRDLHAAVSALQSLLKLRPDDPDALERMAEAFASLKRKDKAAEVVLRLARILAERGPHAMAEARRLVTRGLRWDPTNRELAALSSKLADRPRPVARELVVPNSTPPLDLSEFVEVAGRQEPRQETIMLDMSELELLGELSRVGPSPSSA